MNGVLLVNKDSNMTSRDVVNIVSKQLHTKKVGHTGTLDPIATGVLVICVGKYTKLCEVLTGYNKEYEATIELGYLTDTIDSTGNILEDSKCIKNEDEIRNVLNSMIGEYDQEVPIYSAVRVDGKRLYEYARNNEEVILPSRKVSINSIELISNIEYKNNHTIFSIRTNVSKGTYIRSLIRDIAVKLDTVGTMTSLCRTKQGFYNINDSYTIDQIKNDEYKFLSEEVVFNSFYTVEVDEALKKMIKNGAIIENRYDKDIVLFKDNDTYLAIYKIYEKDNMKMKPWKMF